MLELQKNLSSGGTAGAGGQLPPHILADQLTIFQPREQIMPTTLLLAPPPPGFLDLPTDLTYIPDPN